jgi:hypothetical protein
MCVRHSVLSTLHYYRIFLLGFDAVQEHHGEFHAEGKKVAFLYVEF